MSDKKGGNISYGLLGLGFLAGAIGALLGVGGGVLLVPALALVAGLELRTAVGVSLVSVVAMSVSGCVVFLRKGQVDIATGVTLQFFSVVGAVTAGLFAPFVPEAPLFFLFSVILLYTAFRMWPRRMTIDPPPLTRAHRARAASVSFGAGGLSGLLGVGGGFMGVPVLHLLHGLPFPRAAATSIFMVGGTASAGAIVYLVRGDVAVSMAALTAVGAALGASVAARLGHRISQLYLTAGFALLLGFISILMLRRGLAAI